MIIAPSILSADFSRLLEEVKSVEEAGCEFLHIDVMDGHFVPNITLGPVVYQHLKPYVKCIFDVHLMIENPKFYAKAFVDAGADYLTFHYEAVDDIYDMIKHLRFLNVKVGISIKPKTDIKVLDNVLSLVDLVLVMSVEPGFGGQTFMDSALDKIEYLKEKKLVNNYSYLIEVDGGINKNTAYLCKQAGVDILVAGTYIFNSKNRKQTIQELKTL